MSDPEYDSVDSSAAFDEWEGVQTGEFEASEPAEKIERTVEEVSGTGSEAESEEEAEEQSVSGELGKDHSLTSGVTRESGSEGEEEEEEGEGEEVEGEEVEGEGEEGEGEEGGEGEGEEGEGEEVEGEGGEGGEGEEVEREEGEGEEVEGEEGEGEKGEEGKGERVREGMELESSDDEIEGANEESTSKGVNSRAFLDSDDSEGEFAGKGEGAGNVEPVESRADGDRTNEGQEGVPTMSAGGRKFLEDSDDEEARPDNQSVETAEEESRDDSQEDVFGGSDDEGGSSGKKRKRESPDSDRESEGETESGVKRLREASGSGDEVGEEGAELEELRQEVELGEEGEGGREGVPDVGGERVVGEGNEEEEEPASDDEPGPSTVGMSDWDVMMQRRREAMARARKRRKRDIDITAVDDHIMAMIRGMRHSVEEDRQLNQARQPALKKLKMLPTVITNLKKSDLQTSFIECGILTVLSEWLSPLPDNSLPHLKIREAILDILKSYPIPESHILKSSRIGKAVMMLYRHPKETRKNKEKAGKIINEWARPIFGLASDFKSLGRDEREERDYANLSQAVKRRLSSSGSDPKKSSQEEEYEPSKPGDKGWIGRARVPMPSTRDYVVRPKWKAEQEYKRGPSKKVLNRYEKQMNKAKQRKSQGKSSHAISISVEGRKMSM